MPDMPGMQRSSRVAPLAPPPPDGLIRIGPALYVKTVGDTKGSFTSDGKMPAEGPANALRVLASFNETVIAKKDTIDLAKTFTTKFVDAGPAG